MQVGSISLGSGLGVMNQPSARPTKGSAVSLQLPGCCTWEDVYLATGDGDSELGRGRGSCLIYLDSICCILALHQIMPGPGINACTESGHSAVVGGKPANEEMTRVSGAPREGAPRGEAGPRSKSLCKAHWGCWEGVCIHTQQRSGPMQKSGRTGKMDSQRTQQCVEADEWWETQELRPRKLVDS